jgi:uncharacterized protein (DUF1330 family)
MSATGQSAAYLIADIDVRDAERYEAYKQAVPALIAKHGGEYVVRGAEAQVVEGDWQPARLVLLRFPTRAALQAFLDDPDYRPLKALRQEVARSNVLVVDGYGA